LGVGLTILPRKKGSCLEASKNFSQILWRRPRPKLGCGAKERERERERNFVIEVYVSSNSVAKAKWLPVGVNRMQPSNPALQRVLIGGICSDVAKGEMTPENTRTPRTGVTDLMQVDQVLPDMLKM
jgi:hypothetical protein